jgi:hypothetical protein
MKKTIKIIGIMFISVLTLLCAWLYYFYAIKPEMRFRKCYAEFSERADIKNDANSIFSYVNENIKVGMSEEDVYRKLEEMGGFEPGSLPHWQDKVRNIVLVNCDGEIYDYHIYLEFKDGVLDDYRGNIYYIDM